MAQQYRNVSGVALSYDFTNEAKQTERATVAPGDVFSFPEGQEYLAKCMFGTGQLEAVADEPKRNGSGTGVPDDEMWTAEQLEGFTVSTLDGIAAAEGFQFADGAKKADKVAALAAHFEVKAAAAAQV